MTTRSSPRRRLRGSTATVIAFGGLFLVAAALWAVSSMGSDVAGRRARAARLVADLALSDVALFTEARYTRNPSLADLHTPFQDGPASLEHFPTASLVVAPRGLPAGRLEARED
jgi:hypothetical protein